jgi:peptidoglycan/LPS O-acetylase OafA/YrhL
VTESDRVEFPAANQAGISSRKIHSLTSARFLAAFSVVLYHSSPLFLPIPSSFGLERPPQGLIGHILFSLTFAISFFFMLSGYVLAKAYLRDGEKIDVRTFFVARFARFYPLYVAVMVLDLPELLSPEIRVHGIATGLFKTVKILAANLAMLQAWFPERLLRINGPSWTLSAEIFFYVCFPLLGVALWRLRGARLWLTALTLYAGGQILFFTVRPHLGRQMALYCPLLHLSTFALGILLARWQSLQQQRSDDVVEINPWQAYAVLGVSIAGVVLAVLLVPHFFVPGICNDGLTAPIIGGFIWALSAAPTAVSRWLSASWLVILGDASYALYLVHYPFLILFLRFHWTAPLAYPLYLAICVAVSVLSVRYFETPARHWLLLRSRTRSREPILAATSVTLL